MVTQVVIVVTVHSIFLTIIGIIQGVAKDFLYVIAYIHSLFNYDTSYAII